MSAQIHSDRWVAVFALVSALLLPGGAADADPVSLSPDITVTLDGVNFSDESVGEDDGLGTTLPVTLGALPASATVTAYHPLANGDALFSLDTTTRLMTGFGLVTFYPGDVVRYGGIGYALEFDSAAAGIPAGVSTDALSRTSGGDLLLSFDTTVDLTTTIATDEDLVSWNGASFALVFDGSAEGISDGLDLDAAHVVAGSVLALSFDAGGSVGGVVFDDDDVLQFDPSGPTWTLAYDASAQHAAMGPADVEAIALPEPARILQLASGLMFLALARWRSQRRG
jgi:hypothetical protein